MLRATARAAGLNGSPRGKGAAFPRRGANIVSEPRVARSVGVPLSVKLRAPEIARGGCGRFERSTSGRSSSITTALRTKGVRNKRHSQEHLFTTPRQRVFVSARSAGGRRTSVAPHEMSEARTLTESGTPIRAVPRGARRRCSRHASPNAAPFPLDARRATPLRRPRPPGRNPRHPRRGADRPSDLAPDPRGEPPRHARLPRQPPRDRRRPHPPDHRSRARSPASSPLGDVLTPRSASSPPRSRATCNPSKRAWRQSLEAAGVYTPETRPFRPHVTLARLRPRTKPPRGTALTLEPRSLPRRSRDPLRVPASPGWRAV